MIAFWAICGLLIAVALSFVLIPLLRHHSPAAEVDRSGINVSLYQQQLLELESDQKNGILTADQYALGREEIQKRLLEDVAVDGDKASGAGNIGRTLAVVVGIMLPVLSVSLYYTVGKPGLIEAKAPVAAPGDAPSAQQQMTPEKMEQMTAQLAKRMEKEPQNAQGWMMLGRSYEVLNRFPEAAKAFEQASKLLPNDAQAMSEYAEALMLANKNDFHGKPIELALKALKIDPNNQKALLLAGAAASEAKDFAKVVEYWERLYVQLPPDSEDAQAVASGVEGARKAAKAMGIKLPPSKLNLAKSAAAFKPGVSGAVMLKESLASKVSPEDTLYIFARAATGPKMPLAILKISAKELPLTFSLDDSLAVSPTMKLSDFKEVVVGVLVSKSGNARPQKGDLQGSSKVVGLGSQNVQVLIDSVVP